MGLPTLTQKSLLKQEVAWYGEKSKGCIKMLTMFHEEETKTNYKTISTILLSLHTIGDIHAKINNGGKFYVTFILYTFLDAVLIF